MKIPPITGFPLNGLLCSACGAPQYQTPSGTVCRSGHGGAEGGAPPADYDAARAERDRLGKVVQAAYVRWLLQRKTEGSLVPDTALGPWGTLSEDARELSRYIEEAVRDAVKGG